MGNVAPEYSTKSKVNRQFFFRCTEINMKSERQENKRRTLSHINCGNLDGKT